MATTLSILEFGEKQIEDRDFPELRSALSGEWIHLQDMHAIFAGWLPLEPFNGPWGNIDKQRRYMRISTGKEAKPAESDFVEMARLSGLYGEVDLLIKTRNDEIDGNGNAQIELRMHSKSVLNTPYRSQRPP